MSINRSGPAKDPTTKLETEDKNTCQKQDLGPNLASDKPDLTTPQNDSSNPAARSTPRTSSKCNSPGCRAWTVEGNKLCRVHLRAKNDKLAESWVKSISSKASYSPAELDCISWKSLAWVKRLAGGGLGSSGVFLLEVEQKLLVIKPGSSYTAGEAFCAILYKRLGIHVPRQRVLHKGCDDEFDLFCKGVKSAKYVDPSDKDAILHYISTQPFFSLSEVSASLVYIFLIQPSSMCFGLMC
jgi:hypothetical protein